MTKGLFPTPHPPKPWSYCHLLPYFSHFTTHRDAPFHSVAMWVRSEPWFFGSRFIVARDILSVSLLTNEFFTACAVVHCALKKTQRLTYQELLYRCYLSLSPFLSASVLVPSPLVSRYPVNWLHADFVRDHFLQTCVISSGLKVALHCQKVLFPPTCRIIWFCTWSFFWPVCHFS